MLVIKKRVPVVRIVAATTSLLSLLLAGVFVLPVFAERMLAPIRAEPLAASAPAAPNVLFPQTASAATSDPSPEKIATHMTQSPTPHTAQPMPESIQMLDHFDGSTLNSGLWEAVTLPKAYRNNEEQDYRPSQVTVAAGNLQITATRDAQGEWHSGEVHSKWSYTYGDFEVRAALSAAGPGVWPAAWLMGTTDQWPDGGEIDILENINGLPTAYGTIHGGGTNGPWRQQAYAAGIPITQFHTYKISKRPGVISWWVDGVKFGEWTQNQMPAGGAWPFESHRNFGLLNLAIGGTWPGPSNAATPETITMYVDYFSVKNAW